MLYIKIYEICFSCILFPYVLFIKFSKFGNIIIMITGQKVLELQSYKCLPNFVCISDYIWPFVNNN